MTVVSDMSAADPGPVAHRPQTLVFSVFGGVALADGRPPMPTKVFLRVLGELGVAEAAVRATLARMTKRGLLERIPHGRETHIDLTRRGRDIVLDARRRVSAAAPFREREGSWTMLTYSIPESQRALRHRLRVALAWAGFGGLSDGVWIAPGTVDVGAFLADDRLEDARDLAYWFSAQPMVGVDMRRVVGDVWRVEDIRAEHERFIARWSDAGLLGPLAAMTLMGADWVRLLRHDPGLPADLLGEGWPADESVRLFRETYDMLLPLAEQELDALLDAR